MTFRHLSLAGMLMLASCSLIKTSTSTSYPGKSSPESSPSPASTPSSSAPDSSTASASSSSSGGEWKDPKEPDIVGLSIDDAKKKIKASGFEGEVEVLEQSEFDKECKAETVCGFTPRRWYLNQERRMTLYKNAVVKIAIPD